MNGELQNQWLFARVELGMSKAEFGACTPAEWVELLRLWKVKQDRHDRRVARIMMAVSLTIPRAEGTQLPTEDDFMPKPVEPPEPLTDEQLQEQFMRATSGKHHEFSHG